MNVRLNKKHQKTLEAIFSTQVPATLQWRRIETLFMALGATRKEGSGSIVTFKLKDEDALFHRPHPQKEAKRYHVRKAREFLEQVGITP
ncbi:MAG: type II toxin-antitoxin system HicA family toxin [Candidatus Poribacteria bacterium]|nr:type II toxin-antitoxin system HicA family toxin [Candidatus Poribacteria bacterium]